ncbi:MAG: hypothetical protein RL732_1234 [Bacteroidota bacterium]
MADTYPSYDLFNALPDPVFIYDDAGHFEFLNRQAQKILDAYQEIKIHDFFDFFRSGLDAVKQEHDLLKRLDTPDEIRNFEAHFDADPTYLRYAEISCRILNSNEDKTFFISQVRLFEFKRELELEKGVFVEKYESLLENTPAMIWVSNRENRPIYCNKSLREFLGRDFAKIPTQQEFEGMIHPEDHAIAIDGFNTAILKKERFAGEFRIRSADGSYKWVLEEAHPQFDRSGSYLGYNGKFSNITNVKNIQATLDEAQLQMQLLVKEGGFFIFEYDHTGALRNVSRSCYEITGYTPEELQKMDPARLIHPDDFAEHFQPEMLFQYLNKYHALTFRILTPENKYKWIELNGVTLHGPEKGRDRIICLAKDVTERLQLSEQMEMSNRFLVNTQSIIVVTDKNRRIEWVNASFTKISGYTLDEVIGKKPSDFLQGKDTDKSINQFIHNKLEAGESFECELLNYSKSGKPYWVHFSCEAIRNIHGEIEKFFAIQEDITEKKMRDIDLQIAASFPRLNPNPIFRINKKGDIIFKNQAAANMQVIYYNESYCSLNEFCRTIAASITDRLEIASVEIDRNFYTIICIALPDTDFINIYCNDITALSNVALRLKNSERKYRLLTENSKNLICLHNVYGQILFVSPSSDKLIQYTPEQLLGVNIIALCHPQELSLLKESFEAILNNTELIKMIEVRLKNKKGSYHWFEMQLYAVMENEQVAGIQSSSRDITQIKYQDVKLKVNELKYRRLIDNMDLGYIEVDNNGKVVYANDSFCRMTKYSQEELLGNNPEELILPLDVQKKEMREHNEHRMKGIAEVYQLQIRRKDGVFRTLLISGTPLLDEEVGVIGSAGIHWDITPMLEMEMLLQDKELQRQRSILQASIRTEEKQKQTLGRELHDGLGQLLAYISLNMQLLLDKKANAEEIVNKTKQLINNAIAEVRQLSRTLIPVSLDTTKSLKDIITETLALFANMKGVRFEIEWYDPLIDAKLNVDQKHILYRIIQELTNNTIKYAEATLITLTLKSSGKNCLIEYTDNGRGFDMKKVKKGVGFESIQTRVDSYNGKLKMTSSKGKGVKVQVAIPFLPAASLEAALARS